MRANKAGKDRARGEEREREEGGRENNGVPGYYRKHESANIVPLRKVYMYATEYTAKMGER